ncbi:MAG TPA: adenylate/guanylate cyclase domain-containing protein [Polyangiaceae bacterium]|nr:adenylate/guanylate cyclase domain-containing protein [Polyangiaceae bacterium]
MSNARPSESPRRIESAFGFVDLEGFTALTETHGDEDAAQIATRFAKLTGSVLGKGDRLVKTIGDAVLVTSPNAASGVALVERLFTEAAADERLPALRAGLHFGSAVEKDGDVFGAVVNLAARVAAEAHAGEVLGTQPIADAARAAGLPVAELGAVSLKNVRGKVSLFSLALVVGVTETPIDPVCQTAVDRRTAAGRLSHDGNDYWFCSLTCAAAFASNPGWHAK